MTLTFKTDLDINVNQHAKYPGRQKSVSVHDTHTHTHQTNFSTWTVKVVFKITHFSLVLRGQYLRGARQMQVIHLPKDDMTKCWQPGTEPIDHKPGTLSK